MTNVKTRKWLSLAVAVLMVLGMVSFLPALPVAQAASYSSSWFTDKSAINVASVHEGITLRPTEKTPLEYGQKAYDKNDEGTLVERATSYATYANEVYLGKKFTIKFEVLKKNFEAFEITFLSDDNSKVSDVEDIRVHDIENKVVLPASKLKDGENELVASLSEENNMTFTLNGSALEVEGLEALALNQARIKFGFTKVSEVFEKDTGNEDEEDNTEYDYASICLTGMGEGENIQSFVTRNEDSSIINDEQKPVIRIDTSKLLPDQLADELAGVDDIIVLDTEYSVSYTQLDVIKSTTSTRMTVKYSETLPDDYAEKSPEDQKAFWDGEEIETFRENITTTRFTPNKAGYYAVTSLIGKDGTNDSELTVGNDGEKIDVLVFYVVNRLPGLDNETKNAAIGYNFENYRTKYAQFPKTLEGGKNATVTFITPELWQPAAAYTAADLIPAEGETESRVEKDFKASGADFYSVIGVRPDGTLIFEPNADAVTTSLKYRLSNSSSYTTLTGLRFTPSAKGPYDFSLSFTDRIGNKTEFTQIENFLEGITFYDTEAPEISVTGFNEIAYLNQSTTIASGSIIDNFDTSATKTVTVILTSKYKINSKGELIDKDGRVIDTSGDFEDYKDKLVIDDAAITWKQKQGTFRTNDEGKLVDKDGSVIRTENGKLTSEADEERLVRDDLDGIRVKNVDGDYILVDDYEQDYEKDDQGNAVLDEDGNKQYLYEMNEDGTYKVDDEGRRIPLYNQKNRQELVVSTSTSFTPTDYGIYKVVYEGKDSSGNIASYQVHELYVVPAPPAPVGEWFNLSTTSIVFLCIAGACFIGIVVLLCLPTKEEPKKIAEKSTKKEGK